MVMSLNEAVHPAIGQLMKRVEACGLGSESGALLYSGLQTLVPGPLYLLGTNPGGEYGETIAKSLLRKGQDPTHNEYLHGCWEWRGVEKPAGEHPLQQRIIHLISHLGLPVCEVCASNLILIQSSRVARLGDFMKVAKKCWPIHQFILEHLQPKAIIAFGNGAKSAYAWLRQCAGEPEESFPADHGHWKCRTFAGAIHGPRVRVIGLPHLSWYDVRTKPEVLKWVKEQVKKAPQ